MSPSDKYDSESIRKMRETAASAAAQMPQHYLDPHTVSAMSSLAQTANAFGSHRDEMFKQMAPAMASLAEVSRYKTDVLAPGLGRIIASMDQVNSVTEQFALSPAVQAMFNSAQTQYAVDSVISPEFVNAMADVINKSVDTRQFAQNLLMSPGITDAIKSIEAVNLQVNSFAETYAKTMAPVMESFRVGFQGTKIFDDFDFSALDDVDEEAFEGFLDEHPELEETYESIEQSMVEHGLISEGTFAKVGARFKSLRIAKQAAIVLLLFSLATVITVAGSNLPEDRQDDALAFGTVLALVYGVYGVQVMIKSTKPQKPAAE